MSTSPGYPSQPGYPPQQYPPQPGPAQPGPAQPGPAQPGPAQPGPAQPGSAQSDYPPRPGTGPYAEQPFAAPPPAGFMVVTMNDIPGWRIDEVLGEVFGLTVRSRNIGSQFGAFVKAIFGGELRGMTKVLISSRNEVMARLIAEAQGRGANAVVAMRFDTSEMGGTWTEICAYGTAVRASKL